MSRLERESWLCLKDKTKQRDMTLRAESAYICTIGAAILLAAIAGPTVYCVPLSSSTRRAGTALGGP